mmetsp:Transcript_12575/g.12202  ORF Transcript_12575/g.12202 Transcript_12575/m.12202 type:complete len:198 (-) Transcript_12575:17-610(-)|eukprot:CAMPEP_0119043818 /NCGR_PEP_ID=MMETSP1177-20130426/26135_1 /TAXON_ID=2985 /ORGANISM="Ochromonas sp, Strain CCMP1899" /LENGTH=197 /DNA_ID=CAMNT_0007012773 /DNA_START=35 /DNA_END=628 /DNA_ORIENTATION=-
MTSTATASTSAYIKIFLHAAKFSSCAIGGYLIGTSAGGGKYEVTDVVPICHSNPCGPMLEIAAAMAEKIYAPHRILGYYFANESSTSIQLAYIEKMVQGIKENTKEAALLFEINNSLIHSSDTSILKGKLGGQTIHIEMKDTIVTVNNYIDKMLSLNSHQYLVDFEDHMDTAAASDKNETVADFRNTFINKAVANMN